MTATIKHNIVSDLVENHRFTIYKSFPYLNDTGGSK